MLFFGWLATIHQSLLLSVPGMEILIALMLPRLGRDLFVWNTVVYVVILGLKLTGTIPALCHDFDRNKSFSMLSVWVLAAGTAFTSNPSLT